MKRYIKFFILFAASVAAAHAQTGENKIKLWPEGKMPGTSAPEFTLDERGRVASVKTPVLELFLVKSQKPAPFVIVCPGGGYNKLAPHEGNKIAKKLNENGISAAVLYYRVPQNPDGALADALRAIRIARQNSLPEYWNIGKIGIMGFSAGANLSARASANYAKQVYEAIDNMDNLSARPDFTLLIYPAYCDKPGNDKRWNKTKQDPAADYNTVDTGDTVTFTVSATDESGAAAANTATVTLVITEENSAPTLAIDDQYVLPDDMGKEMTVTATAEMGDNEENQSISEANIEVLSGAEIFSVAPAVAFSGKDITITYTVAADAELTAPAELKVTIKDDGTTAGAADPQSAEATFKVFLGGSPWYPSIAFECVDTEAHAEGHTVVIDGSDGSSYSITLKGANYEVKPADYVAIGHPGYEPGTELTATVYVWTQKGGTSKEVCAEVEATVADYDEPGEATASADPEVGENGWVTLPDVSVPLAQSYTVTVKDENGKTTQTIGPVDFEPNDEGMILPNIQGLKIQLPDAGTYTISVTGENPAGEGETTDLFEVVIEEDSVAELVWGDGSFTPENGAVLTSESVKFSWPIASGAKSYTLTVYNADGTKAATKSGISGTSQTLTLKMKSGEATPYTWSVTATSGKKTIVSNDFSFTLCESTDSVIITSVAAGEDGLQIGYAGTLDDGIAISFDYQFFDVSEMKWTNGTAKATAGAESVLDVVLSGVEAEAEDYVVLQLKVNGKKQGDWVIYQVQDSL